MADTHIDYNEVTEYGNHSVQELKKLEGLSPLVDVVALRARLVDVLSRFSEKRKQATVIQSGLRSGRGGTEAATTEMRDKITRFHSYLNSFDPKEVTVDIQAFFPGGNLGQLAALKPADVLAKADEVLRGFEAKENQSFPQRDDKKTKLEKAREELSLSLGEKDGKRGDAILDTSALAAVYQEFLSFYNGTAKPLIRGLLNDLGRGAQMHLYFKDLQVNEGAPAQGTTSTPTDPGASSEQDAAPVVAASPAPPSEPGATGEPTA